MFTFGSFFPHCCKQFDLENQLNWLGLPMKACSLYFFGSLIDPKQSFGLVDDIPPSITRIFFPNLAGLHSLDKLRPALGRRMPAQLDSLTINGTRTTAVAIQGLQ